MSLKDVAKIANVSISTVSRVVNSNNEKCATKEVRERIWDAVKQCGYVPNKTAQRLKMSGSDVADEQVVSIMFARNEDKQTNYFFSELAEYVKVELVKQGMKIGESYELINNVPCEMVLPKPSKNHGVVVLGKAGREHAEFISAWGQRVVFVTLNQMYIDYDHVLSDGERASYLVMEYLHKRKHSKIAYIGEYHDEGRYRGYKNYLIKNKLPSPREYVINTTMTEEGGKMAVQTFMKLKDRPTAIFCANDVTAFGVINGLMANGLKVPQDISVISVDNIKEAEVFKVPLTTVKVPLNEMGSFAVKILKDRLDRGHSVPLNVFMPAELVVRSSVK